MTDSDLHHLRTALQVAERAREHGNHPFGAVLVDENNQVLMRAENTVTITRDCTGHAETNLMRAATQQLPPEVLATATLYASTEPCPMCAGSWYWGGVRGLVVCVGCAALYQLMPPGAWALELNAAEVLARGAGSVEVIGPLLVAEGLAVHAGFWG